MGFLRGYAGGNCGHYGPWIASFLKGHSMYPFGNAVLASAGESNVKWDHSVGGSRGAGRHGASCLALPRLCLRILFGSGSSGSFGSAVAVAQPSPKTLGLRD